MRINIKFIYLFLGIGIVYFTDALFLDVAAGGENELQLPVMRLVWVFTFVGSLYFINYMSPFMRAWCLMCTIYFFYLILESLYLYGSPFQFPRVFAKSLELFSIFYVYVFYKRFKDKITVEHVVNFIFIFFVLNSVLVNRDAYSMSSFTSHDRGFHAESVYMLIIPVLFYFNRYFSDRQVKYILYCGFFLAIIVFLQHRTVWICTSVALAVNLLLIKKANLKIDLSAFIPISLILFVIIFFAGFFIATNEEIVSKLNENIDDIANPTGQGTGNWRWVQFTSYWPFIVDNFIFGMRLQGFELPVQFFDRDTLAFEDGTGHHFHSFYVDKLFYFGALGLLLVILPTIIYIVRLVAQNKSLSADRVAFVAYIATAIVYGISYKLQLNVYASIGFLIYLLENSLSHQHDEAEQLANEAEQQTIQEENLVSTYNYNLSSNN